MSINTTLINELTKKYLSEFIAIREHIHAHPELSFQESETAKFISAKLTEFGVTHTSGVAGTGIVALIEGQNPSSKTIALRADMDALPILEKNNTSYCSQNEGIMHACGHDVHSTCLLGAAKILQETRHLWEGTIKCIFQQGEEKHPTLFMYRHKDKPYHIDYCFASIDFIDKLENVEIGNHKDWSLHCDHNPLSVSFNL